MNDKAVKHYWIRAFSAAAFGVLAVTVFAAGLLWFASYWRSFSFERGNTELARSIDPKLPRGRHWISVNLSNGIWNAHAQRRISWKGPVPPTLYSSHCGSEAPKEGWMRMLIPGIRYRVDDFFGYEVSWANLQKQVLPTTNADAKDVQSSPEHWEEFPPSPNEAHHADDQETQIAYWKPFPPGSSRLEHFRLRSLFLAVSGWVPPTLIAAPFFLVFLGRRMRRRLRRRNGRCIVCAYDLTGNTSGVCPECGERI